MRKRARAVREIATAMKAVGVKEGEGGKAMAMATRVVGEWTAMAKTRVMVTKTKEAGEEEGNRNGSKSDGNGEEDGNGE